MKTHFRFAVLLPFLATVALAQNLSMPVRAWSGAAEKLALVTVFADQGKPAAGLTPADFTITEEKAKLDVIEAVPARDPLSVVLLVDTALPVDGAAATPELRKALTAFVATLLDGEPAAQIALYQVSNAGLPVKDFTSSRVVLEAGINSIASGTPPGSAMLEAVRDAAKKVGDRPAPRRAIVAVGIGTQEGTALQPKPVTDVVTQAGATLWVVSVQGAFDSSLTNRDTVWTRGTESTGGIRQNVVQATRLEASLRSVANSLLSQYFLKMTGSKQSGMKGLKGQTAQGAQVLFTRWVR
jgi:hypothetical protein